jgi:hypothetical protein
MTSFKANLYIDMEQGNIKKKLEIKEDPNKGVYVKDC